jgi:hypothetical protein
VTGPSGSPGELDAADVAAVRAQLGREPRGLVAVAARCPCGEPSVVRTAPRLPDGTPFPTTYYVTCPRLAGRISTLEGAGVMAEMSADLASDADLADAYRRAHEDYLDRREALGHVPEIEGVSAGGMPQRVKCLHALVGHSLGVGPGVNPLGDRVIALLDRGGPWWEPPCRTTRESP